MDVPIRWLLDPLTNEYCYWEPRESSYVYWSGRRIHVPNQGTQQASGSPRTPHLPPVPLAWGATTAPDLAGFPASPNDEGAYQWRGTTSPTGLDAQAQSHYSASVQQQLPTSPSLPYYNVLASAETAQLSSLNAAFASASLDSNNPRSQASASNPSRYSLGSGASGIAPEQEAALAARAYVPLHSPDQGETEQLYPQFKGRHPSFFKRGRVFKALWHEPRGGDDGPTNPSSTGLDPRFGEQIFSKIRWFIVIRSGTYFCTCVPIVTYRGQGVSKTGVNKNDHAIAFLRGSQPISDYRETPAANEKPMRRPICIRPDRPGDQLKPMSRIDYARAYTVEHNMKAMAFGWVHKTSEREFLYTFKLVFFPDEVNPEMGQVPQQNVGNQTQDPDNTNFQSKGKARAVDPGAGLGSPMQATAIGNNQQGQELGSSPIGYRSADQWYPSIPQGWNRAQFAGQYQQQVDSQRREQERLEQERREQERLEQARQEQQRIEQQRLERQRTESRQQRQQDQSSSSRGQRAGRSSRSGGGQGSSRKPRGH